MTRKPLGLLFIFYLAAFVTNVVAAPRAESCGLLVEEGAGIGNIVIENSTANDVVAIWGNKYELIDHHGSAYEMKFVRWGVSFYYRRDDAEKKIVSVTAKPARCIIRTKKGIIDGVSTLRDVINVYGKAEPFTSSVTAENKTWFYEYAGIRFHVLFKSWTEADSKDFLKKKIILIEIIKSRRS